MLLVVGRFALLAGAFLTLTSALTAVLNPPGSAEFVISAVTVVIGLVVLSLGLIAVLLERKSQE
ncbi:hypothetical protein Q8791_01400 [Nocardiopsis sp. CT-R113]|uniref:Uncharacterized protein n=1 Tax=Nocardiopsis codii TaxID=3065942 RepID=A0ABU7K0V3_9ACTN|nr:hypothetical protein [Nocardiopsis sp. CT-R113]MEE2035878.1 hypothetical protein [Nocardiopsis sp. CT-R113]